VRRESLATARQRQTLATYVATGGSMARTAAALGISRSTAKRHLADLRARFGLSTEQLIYVGRAAGWLVVEGFEPPSAQISPR
jgi:DNA-binding CsgD family transcriptional regulator